MGPSVTTDQGFNPLRKMAVRNSIPLFQPGGTGDGSNKFMDSIAHRMRRSLAMRGVAGTAQMAWICFMAHLLPGYRRVEAARKAADAAFDAEFGSDTAGVFRPAPDAVQGENWAFGISYQAVDPTAFTQALNQLAIPFEEFTFIDFGSGKGRALLLASQFPFKRVIGVEYCEELNQVARENVARLPASRRRSGGIEIVSGDATKFSIPPGPLLLYFFNPFGEPVMEQVALNVLRAYEETPRQIAVVYFTPYFAYLWEKLGFLSRLSESPAVFDSGPIRSALTPSAQLPVAAV